MLVVDVARHFHKYETVTCVEICGGVICFLSRCAFLTDKRHKLTYAYAEVIVLSQTFSYSPVRPSMSSIEESFRTSLSLLPNLEDLFEKQFKTLL